MVLYISSAIFVSVIVLTFEATCENHQNDEDDVPGEPLSPLDFRNAEKLPSHVVAKTFTETPYNEEDPTEKAGLFEGDIVISDHFRNASAKNAIKSSTGLWRNGTNPILNSHVNAAEQDRSVIARAILEFHRQTCIRFSPRETQKDYVMISSGNGCSSPVGRVGGSQKVTLGNGCMYPGVAMHEFSHSLGFWHEQSRWDRDDYIKVFYENIQPGQEDNFRKISWKETQNLGEAYDTSSIMHYGPYAFSKNRQKGYKTIIPKLSNDNMGQRVNFSQTDVRKINKLYNCGNGSGSETDTQEANANSGSSNQCSDNHQNCEKWASNGECQKNPNWMLVNCKHSCNQCRTCSNQNKHCDAWAANGECKKNPEYMNAQCSKSCKRCH